MSYYSLVWKQPPARADQIQSALQRLLKSCLINALVMLKYLLFPPQIGRLLNCLVTSGIKMMMFPLGGAAAHTSGGKRILDSPSAPAAASILVK